MIFYRQQVGQGSSIIAQLILTVTGIVLSSSLIAGVQRFQCVEYVECFLGIVCGQIGISAAVKQVCSFAVNEMSFIYHSETIQRLQVVFCFVFQHTEHKMQTVHVGCIGMFFQVFLQSEFSILLTKFINIGT